MRITSGHYRGRPLLAPEGLDVRPTADKVRQAMFNILLSHGYPDGAHVIDGFCGTGALGLEALSRGAVSCTFIDNAAESLSVCALNIEKCGATDSATLMKRDLAKLPARPPAMPPADLFFLDPPYRKDLIPRALESLASGWLAADALGVLEIEKGAHMDPVTGFDITERRTYGQTDIVFCRYHGS